MNRIDNNEDYSQEPEDPIDYREVLLQMRRIGVCLKHMCDLPPGELAMLITMAKMSEPDQVVRPSSLGREMHLSRPAVSRMLRSLREKDYLNLSIQPEDHRYVKVSLTEKGRESADREVSQCTEILKKVVSRMGSPDLRHMLYYNEMFINYLVEELR